MHADEESGPLGPRGNPEGDGEGAPANGNPSADGGGNGKAPAEDWDTLRRFQGFQRHDPEAQSLFCLHYEPHIRRFVRAHPVFPWLERRGWTLEDVRNEVFVKFLEDAPRRFQYRGKGSMEAWLKVLTQRAVISLFRREASDKRGGGGTDVPLAPELDEHFVGHPRRSPDEDPVSGAAAREFWELAAQILTADEFCVLEMSDREGFTDTEIAEATGRSPSAVRSILYRARQKLRSRLEA